MVIPKTVENNIIFIGGLFLKWLRVLMYISKFVWFLFIVLNYHTQPVTNLVNLKHSRSALFLWPASTKENVKKSPLFNFVLLKITLAKKYP